MKRIILSNSYFRKKRTILLFFGIMLSILSTGSTVEPSHTSKNIPIGSILKDSIHYSIYIISKKQDKNILYIESQTHNRSILKAGWPLDYPIYRTEIGDIDGDGSQDILIGVIKTTRFDPHLAKRIFIFKNYEGYPRPLWLGSRVSQPLIDFRVKKSNNKSAILTIEKEKNGTVLVAEYTWKGFGLGFIQYRKRNTTLKDAYTTIHKLLKTPLTNDQL
ncbi:MAG: hypothetical protein Q8859_12435 [Bacteroidota bacterium]|nr:hypothetical protein [Bacteroidota bacterium]